MRLQTQGPEEGARPGYVHLRPVISGEPPAGQYHGPLHHQPGPRRAGTAQRQGDRRPGPAPCHAAGPADRQVGSSQALASWHQVTEPGLADKAVSSPSWLGAGGGLEGARALGLRDHSQHLGHQGTSRPSARGGGAAGGRTDSCPSLQPSRPLEPSPVLGPTPAGSVMSGLSFSLA